MYFTIVKTHSTDFLYFTPAARLGAAEYRHAEATPEKLLASLLPGIEV